MKTLEILRRRADVLIFFGLALFCAHAFAAIDNSGILDNVLTRYSNAASGWSTVVTNRASWLFWLLVIISMVWTFGMMALRKADLGEFYAEFIRFTVFTGFFWWLLTNGPSFALSIMNSLRQIGAEATGLGSTLAPSGIVDIGFDIFFKVIDQSSVWSPVDSACGIIIAAIILVVFALVGVNMLLLLISSWILAYAGVFFLGFGGSRWTSDMAIGYYKTVMNIAGQLLAMVLLVGIGKSFVDQYYQAMSAGISLKELGVMLVVAAILLALVKTIPGLIGGLAGGNTGSLGNGFGAGAALGAAAMGAAALGVAGSAITAGSAGIAGGAQALMAAFSKANAAESSASSGGMGAVVNAAGGASTDSPMAGSGNSGGASGSGSALAAAMGDSGSSKSGPTASSSSPASGASSFSSNSSGGADSKPEAPATGAKGAESATNEGGSQKEAKPGGARSGAGAVAAKIGKVAAGTAVNLAQGSWDVAKAKASELKESAMDRIGETTGGKIAAAIKARDAAARGKTAQFDEDSLSAGSKSVDAESEIAAFRDRKSTTS